MKLPNGYGSVYKLKGKRRNPWVARKTVGWKDNAQPIYEYLGYYEKRELALKALTAYNLDPYDLANQQLTFTGIYDLWVKQKYTDNGKKIKNGYAAAYKACDELYDMIFTDIRTAHMQKALNEWNIGYSSKKNMRILFGQLFDFAMQNDIVKKDYAEYVSLEMPEEGEQKHKPFTAEELATLWDNSADKAARIVLIYCYSGMRPTEFIRIKTTDVFLAERYMIGGIKTKNSKNRAIPIAEKIYQFIESISLIGGIGNPSWRIRHDHLPHDGRHTCATLLDNAGANKTVIKKILGHAGHGMTQKVYTHKTIQQLVDAINLI